MQRIAPILPFKPARAFRLLGNLSVTSLMLVFAPDAGAQSKRCDLSGRDTTITGNPTAFKRCLDLAELDGKTLTVPTNVTRIDNDGLSLCKSAVQTGGNADIVYVYDNSGSMDAVGRAGPGNLPRAYVSGSDTTFFFNTGGCQDTTTNGTVTFSVYNRNGIGTSLFTIPRLVSKTNCTDFSGDPYNARGAAFRLGLDHQASRAPLSTAGIMSFTGTTANIQHPLVLNPANLTTVENHIDAYSNGGTNYHPPLDTSKNWLVGTQGLTSNPNKAVLFLSDGRPNDTYLDILDSTYRIKGKMPPIYGIFLGNPRPDTAALADLAKRTGGKFYLIPPNRPDSLNSVVDAILNIILLEYQPNAATVTNASMVPAQTATSSASDFILQSDGSWLMELSDVIGLRASNSNAISVATTFKEKASGAVENKTINFTIKTTDPAATTSQKITNTQFAVTCYEPSLLRILNAAGVRPAFFTDADVAYRSRVRTSPVPLDSVSIPARTAILGDVETAIRKPPVTNADSMVFTGSSTFKVLTAGGKTNGNGILESSLYDSIIVSWVHPRDPQDTATDFMLVRAAKQQATVWFSQTSGGVAITQYLVDAKDVFVVIKDQPAEPGRTYTAVVTAEKFGIDRETVTLSESPNGSGTLIGKLAVSILAKNSGDNLIQVSAGGDQLRVVYKDPVDGDSAVATAGFDENVQEAPTIAFTDADGNVLAPDAIWSPAKGKLYLTYSDDYAYGRVPDKQVSLTLDSRKYGTAIGTDHERITMNMKSGSSGTRAAWTGSIDLADAFPAADSNGKAETRFRGEATITANGHDNVGTQQTTTVSASLVIAYPDSIASIRWKMDTTVTVNEGMIFTIKDQSYTSGVDSALVNVACVNSGDSVSGFAGKEGSATSGSYLTGTLAKDEGAPNLTDKVLSCLVTDRIRVRYLDPVYGTLTEILINEVARPEANPPGRKFITSELVTITSATPGAVIYYTLDGSTPVPGASPVYTDPIRVSVTTTIKAIAAKPGYKNSKVMVQTYTKEFVASRLEILDENGNTIPGGQITGAAKGVRVKLITTQDNFAATEGPAITRLAGDSETVQFGNRGSLGNAIEFTADMALRHPSAKTAGNDTLEATGTDTLIVRWVNPFNSNDAAADTVIIKPAFVEAQVYFTAIENGPKITEYPVGQDSIFIVVKTRPRDPAMTYMVTVASNDGSGDKETLTLTELTPGVFSAKAPVGTGAKSKGDKTIQVAAAGDQLTAVFTDPVYLTDYRGDAGFAQQVQESASLEFIDEAGNVVPPTDLWGPAKGKVYLRFSDDWNPGIAPLVRTRTASLKLVNRKSGDSVGADVESVVLTLKDSTNTRGTWEGSIRLADKAPAKNGNDTVETYYRGELRATVKPHDNAGNPSAPDVSDDLVIAYPDQPAEIVIRDTSGKSVDRITTKVDIIIRDQLLTKSGDATITATATCGQSGDKVSNLTFVWNGTAYVLKPPLDKGELSGATVNKNDSILVCRDSDVLTVTYTDPVYGATRTADVSWIDDPAAGMYYGSSKDGTPITSVSDAISKDFKIFVKGKSPSRDKVDTIEVVLTTAQGEKESFKAVETGIFTGIFTVKVDYKFQSGDPAKEDKALEARIDVANRINQVLVNGTAIVSGVTVKADISLLSNYDLVVRAYIKDEDGNGRADHAYFAFDHKLPKLPGSLDEVYWNREGSDFMRKADESMLSFLAGSDSSVVVADFGKSQFGANLTDIDPAEPFPYGLFPDDNVFGGQKARLADSVGPVVVTALKRPSNLQSYTLTATEKRFNPDTLIITVSEKIKASQAFDAMLRFSKGCADYDESAPVLMLSQPAVSVDGLTWTAILDNSPDAQTPLIKDCIFLEADGRFTDMPGNRPARLGVELTGENPKLVIREFRGFPPVAGLDPSTPGFVISTNDQRDDLTGVWSNPSGPDGNSWEVTWIPPYGFDPDDPVGSLEEVARDFDNPSSGSRRPEVATPQPMPNNLSTVQVIASGAYKAQIRIFDNMGHFVRSMNQAYGGNGEDKNPWRASNKGQVSFLVWDMKDDQKNLVGNGVYVWKVAFVFLEKTKKSEVMYTRTGVVRR